MSMASDAGAEVAANEIRVLVLQKIREHEAKPEVVNILKEIKEKSERIIEAARLGYY